MPFAIAGILYLWVGISLSIKVNGKGDKGEFFPCALFTMAVLVGFLLDIIISGCS